MAKLRVGILFGGKSAEHEVSLQSARNIVAALDPSKYEPLLVGIDKNGRWLVGDGAQPLLEDSNPKLLKLNVAGAREVAMAAQSGGALTPLNGGQLGKALDVVFPILHGPFGEDGTVQGLLKLAGVPFVGAGVLGSAVGMDKDVMKRLLRDAGIPIPQFETFRRADVLPSYDQIAARLGKVMFVKPANLGSSVGINKVTDAVSFKKAVDEAFLFDTKILIEEGVVAREIECAVLGNDDPQASVPGEIIPTHAFYSYDAKYIDVHGAALKIPADLPADVALRVREMAVKTFKVLCCEGLGRVDFFLTGNGELMVNEINTMPGFTAISMYPKLWEASGIPYAQLIDNLIQLALDRFEKERRLKTSYE